MNNYLRQNELDVPFHLKKVSKPSGKSPFSKSFKNHIHSSNSNDPSFITDAVSTNRNTQLTYEDISINDILLVTWGSHGTKQYPARCIEKNDEKKELLIHYTGWNSR
jgi:hypothetical protein